ncbi:hypothetical protein I317_03882 [Kwoniella heveanensis CBS 569]|nr:hypothetical protein I317_03882 [Kwoniella heveanensis CBS 569]
MGDDGTGGIQWRCDTDLPSSLRLGKIDVSCEGWSGPGDKNVLQGSCGLTYNLHRVNRGLEYGEDPHMPRQSPFDRLLATSFNYLFWAISLIILYSLIRSLISRFSPRRTPPHISRFLPFLPGPDDGPGGGGPGGGGGGGPGFNPGSGGGQPPPYSKFPHAQTQAQAGTGTPPSSQQGPTAGNVNGNSNDNGNGGWNPGFWTGLAAGGLGTYMMNRNRNQNQAAQNIQQQQQQQNRGGWGRYVPERRFDADDNEYDWENPQTDRGIGSSTRFGGTRRGGGDGGNEGLGEIRRATGFGGSSTR